MDAKQSPEFRTPTKDGLFIQSSLSPNDLEIQSNLAALDFSDDVFESADTDFLAVQVFFAESGSPMSVPPLVACPSPPLERTPARSPERDSRMPVSVQLSLDPEGASVLRVPKHIKRSPRLLRKLIMRVIRGLERYSQDTLANIKPSTRKLAEKHKTNFTELLEQEVVVPTTLVQILPLDNLDPSEHEQKSRSRSPSPSRAAHCPCCSPQTAAGAAAAKQNSGQSQLPLSPTEEAKKILQQQRRLAKQKVREWKASTPKRPDPIPSDIANMLPPTAELIRDRPMPDCMQRAARMLKAVKRNHSRRHAIIPQTEPKTRPPTWMQQLDSEVLTRVQQMKASSSPVSFVWNAGRVSPDKRIPRPGLGPDHDVIGALHAARLV